MQKPIIVMALAALFLSGCDKTDDAEVQHADSAVKQEHSTVTSDQIISADSSGWLSHGRTYSEQRHSPLADINLETVSELGLQWSYDLGTSRGIETTPIVHDGMMYVTSTWNMVHALDARSGEKIWGFDPQVDKKQASRGCCDAVNRGVAIWGNAVFTGTLDGRLISLDAKTGKKNWDINTIDKSRSYTITGAPRIINGKVIIGNGGAEFGVRGYVTAYDAETGKQLWRFYTVPGNPRMVLKTPAWRWQPIHGTANTGRQEGAAQSGIPWPTILSWIFCISV